MTYVFSVISKTFRFMTEKTPALLVRCTYLKNYCNFSTYFSAIQVRRKSCHKRSFCGEDTRASASRVRVLFRVPTTVILI